MKKRNFIIVLIFTLLIQFCHIQAQEINVTILHTNDHHGALEPFEIEGQKEVGGISARTTFIKEIREKVEKQNGGLLVLDCGDINTGTAFSDFLKAKPDIHIMNVIGYDAMALGNHEFDLTLKQLIKQSKQAKFPYLAANIFYRESEKLVFNDVVLFDIKGLTIGVFGITTADTPAVSTYGNNKKIKFVEPEQVIPKTLKKLKKQADLIIGIMHLDHSKAVQLAKKFPGIDIIIGGHTHIATPEPVKAENTMIVEADCHGTMVGKFDLVFKNNKLKSYKYKLIGINLTKAITDENNKILCKPYNKKFGPDPKIEKIMNKYRKQIVDILNQPIGILKEDVLKGKEKKRYISSPIGNLVTDAIKEITNADIALQNFGGLRGELFKGRIAYKDIHQVLPFDNKIYIYKMNGSKILEIFKEMVSGKIGPSGFMEASGLSLQIKNNKFVNVKINNKPIILDAKYKVAINSFIARGGDCYTVFKKEKPLYKTNINLDESLTKYIRKHSPIVPDKTKRIQILSKTIDKK